MAVAAAKRRRRCAPHPALEATFFSGGVVLEVDVGFIHYKFLSCLSEGVESPGYAVCGSLVRGG